MSKLIALLIASICCATPALADEFQPKVGRLEAGLFVGPAFMSGRHGQYSIAEGQNVPFEGVGLSAGLRLAYFWPCRYAGLEVEADGTFASLANDESQTVLNVRGHLIMQDEGRLTPFFLIGAGVIMVSGDTLGGDEDPTLNIGVGVKYHFNDMISLRIEARDMITEGEEPVTLANATAHHFQALVGVSFSFLGS